MKRGRLELPRFLYISEYECCKQTTGHIDFQRWKLAVLSLREGKVHTFAFKFVCLEMLLLGPLGWLVSFAHMAAGLVIVCLPEFGL